MLLTLLTIILCTGGVGGGVPGNGFDGCGYRSGCGHSLLHPHYHNENHTVSELCSKFINIVKNFDVVCM